MAEGDMRITVACQDRIAQLSVEFPRVASGSQWIHASGPGLHRPRRQQEGGNRARVLAAGRELPALRDGSLPAQPALRERRDCGKAPGAAMVVDGCRGETL